MLHQKYLDMSVDMRKEIIIDRISINMIID